MGNTEAIRIGWKLRVSVLEKKKKRGQVGD
jgi:hypothetical protein